MFSCCLEYNNIAALSNYNSYENCFSQAQHISNMSKYYSQYMSKSVKILFTSIVPLNFMTLRDKPVNLWCCPLGATVSLTHSSVWQLHSVWNPMLSLPFFTDLLEDCWGPVLSSSALGSKSPSTQETSTEILTLTDTHIQCTHNGKNARNSFIDVIVKTQTQNKNKIHVDFNPTGAWCWTQKVQWSDTRTPQKAIGMRDLGIILSSALLSVTIPQASWHKFHMSFLQVLFVSISGTRSW